MYSKDVFFLSQIKHYVQSAIPVIFFLKNVNILIIKIFKFMCVVINILIMSEICKSSTFHVQCNKVLSI